MAAGYLQACLYLGFFGPAGSYPLIRKAKHRRKFGPMVQKLFPALTCHGVFMVAAAVWKLRLPVGVPLHNDTSRSSG